jgi:rubrerythrin
MQRRFQVVAQKTKTNKAVVTSNDATVQAAVKLFTQNQALMLYRWECEVCGMVHTGPLQATCDSCGKVGSLIQQPDLHQEMTTD